MIRPFARPLALCLCLGLPALVAGCAEFPQLDGRVAPEDRDAAYPRLVPLGPIVARAGEVTISETTEQGIAARVAALRARAARLRGTVIDGGTRARMRQGVDAQGL